MYWRRSLCPAAMEWSFQTHPCCNPTWIHAGNIMWSNHVHRYIYSSSLYISSKTWKSVCCCLLVLPFWGNYISNRKHRTGGANVPFTMDGLDSDFSTLHDILHYFFVVLLYLYCDSRDTHSSYWKHQYHLHGHCTVHSSIKHTKRESQLAGTPRCRNCVNKFSICFTNKG